MKDTPAVLKDHQSQVLASWLKMLDAKGSSINKGLTADEQQRYSQQLLSGILEAIEHGNFDNIETKEFNSLRELLGELSSNFAERGFSPSDTATYVFSIKSALFEVLKQEVSGTELAERSWQVGTLIDQLGLFTFETFVSVRERMIKAQAQAIAELSTPVIKVWEGILALPLVGSVDSMRAKDIMEKLLEAVVAQEADVVIIDITGVPVVDTEVANRLMRTVESVRLLGTHSIITGINPVIAQTLVQLGVDLSELNTKASLYAGLSQAFRRLKIRVTSDAKV